jgi:hypothetical protein
MNVDSIFRARVQVATAGTSFPLVTFSRPRRHRLSDAILGLPSRAPARVPTSIPVNPKFFAATAI